MLEEVKRPEMSAKRDLDIAELKRYAEEEYGDELTFMSDSSHYKFETRRCKIEENIVIDVDALYILNWDTSATVYDVYAFIKDFKVEYGYGEENATLTTVYDPFRPEPMFAEINLTDPFCYLIDSGSSKVSVGTRRFQTFTRKLETVVPLVYLLTGRITHIKHAGPLFSLIDTCKVIIENKAKWEEENLDPIDSDQADPRLATSEVEISLPKSNISGPSQHHTDTTQDVQDGSKIPTADGDMSSSCDTMSNDLTFSLQLPFTNSYLDSSKQTPLVSPLFRGLDTITYKMILVYR